MTFIVFFSTFATAFYDVGDGDGTRVSRGSSGPLRCTKSWLV